MDLKEIQNLIKFVANSGVAEVKLEMDDVKITIRTTIENTTEATYIQQAPQAPVQQAIAGVYQRNEPSEQQICALARLHGSRHSRGFGLGV